MDRGYDHMKTFRSEDLRLFASSAEMEDYINALRKVKGAGRVCLVCLARKVGGGDSAAYPIQGYYRNLYEGEKGERKFYDKVDFRAAAEIIRDSVSGKKALYGCGYVCDLLLDELFRIDSGDKIHAIFDGNIRKTGTMHRGYKVMYPSSEKLRLFDCIYICSADYEDEIEQDMISKGVLSRKIIKLSEIKR